jgi:hypothetical protein
MSALTGKNPGQNYTGLLHVSGPGPLHATTPRAIVLGDGSATPLSVTATKLYINGVEAGAGGGGGTALTSYATQIATLGDYPLSFPPELGTSGTTACAGNDSRLSNARTPTAHGESHGAEGSDPITISYAQVSDIRNATVASAMSAGETGMLNFGTGTQQVQIALNGDSEATFIFGTGAAHALRYALVAPSRDEAGAVTLALTDHAVPIRMTSGSAVEITIPNDATVAFPDGFIVYFRRHGAGALSLTLGVGVTVNNSVISSIAVGGSFALMWVASNTWDFI